MAAFEAAVGDVGSLLYMEHVPGSLVTNNRLSLGQIMSTDSHVSGGSTFQGGNSTSRGLAAHERTCSGECRTRARAAFDVAEQAGQSLGQVRLDLSKRFQYLYDVSGSDRHKEAEILREHTLALYEALYGQEDPTVAEALLELASLYTAHGNTASAEYMINWANDILKKPKDEPTHEFFHLFGYDKPDEQGDAVNTPINPS